MFWLTITLVTLAPFTVAHMVMAEPKPFNDATTSPLDPSGSNFPCQGTTGMGGASSASVAAGSNLAFKLSGSACHGGGSCQFGLSYDEGKTFMVIQSQIGGCPVQSSSDPNNGQGACQLDFQVPIPKEAPSGSPVFWWSWQNKIGNREFYMNCANIEITSGGGGFTAPAMLVNNVAGHDGGCASIEGDEMVYPNPGNQVVYGGKWASGKPGATQNSACSSQTAEITVQKDGTVSTSGGGPQIEGNTKIASGGGGSGSVSTPANQGNNGQYTGIGAGSGAAAGGQQPAYTPSPLDDDDSEGSEASATTSAGKSTASNASSNAGTNAAQDKCKNSS